MYFTAIKKKLGSRVWTTKRQSFLAPEQRHGRIKICVLRRWEWIDAVGLLQENINLDPLGETLSGESASSGDWPEMLEGHSYLKRRVVYRTRTQFRETEFKNSWPRIRLFLRKWQIGINKLKIKAMNFCGKELMKYIWRFSFYSQLFKWVQIPSALAVEWLLL